jgi:hypothetical protein
MQPFLNCPHCSEPVRFEFSDEETQLIQSVHCQNCGATVRFNELQNREEPENRDEPENREDPVRQAPESTELEPLSEYGASDGMELELELESDDDDVADLAEIPPDSEVTANSETAESETAPPETALEVFETADRSVPWDTLGQATLRPKRKEASILRKVVPPILGGLAAFPIATAIMWYGLGKDLGSTGPFVAKYVPAIVPKHLRTGRIASPEPIRRKPVSPPAIATNLPKLSTNPNKPAVDTEANPSTQQPQEPAMVREETVLQKPVVLDRASSEESQVTKPVSPSLSKQIAALRSLQQDLYSAPKTEKGPMIAKYYEIAISLAQQTESLSGPPAKVWRKELETLSREILNDKNCKTVMQFGPLGKIPGVEPAKVGDYVVTVLDVSDVDAPQADSDWQLSKPWTRGKAQIPVLMKPGAWRQGAATPPTTCLVFGKLVAGELEESLQLHVFAALPQ